MEGTFAHICEKDIQIQQPKLTLVYQALACKNFSSNNHTHLPASSEYLLLMAWLAGGSIVIMDVADLKSTLNLPLHAEMNAWAPDQWPMSTPCCHCWRSCLSQLQNNAWIMAIHEHLQTQSCPIPYNRELWDGQSSRGDWFLRHAYTTDWSLSPSVLGHHLDSLQQLSEQTLLHRCPGFDGGGEGSGHPVPLLLSRVQGVWGPSNGSSHLNRDWSRHLTKAQKLPGITEKRSLNEDGHIGYHRSRMLEVRKVTKVVFLRRVQSRRTEVHWPTG